ncbi:hypothetical protein [Clostridium perfringens]|uniref:hypothetical protein n=1 Tax=Clostridium perfringens TaxID=1502 RepID=UPI0013E3B84D|nr:hypothetical protein [Clostridium perfringens]NGT73925.1 hypothetical protein [Clostridium perfringens]
MELKDIKTLREVSKEYNIAVRTLNDRIKLNSLIEGIDYKKLGEKLPIILSPSGVEKILLKPSKV